MKRIIVYLALTILAVGFYSCTQDIEEKGQKRIMVILEDRLASSLDQSIEQYKSDLEKEGYVVLIENKISASTPPSEIRKMLQKEYDKDENLIAAVLVGNVSAILYNDKENQGDPYWHDFLSDYYYMDLDGIWEDSDNNGVFDQHKDTEIDFWNKIRKKLNLGDNRTPEIWVSRIRADMLTSLGDESSLLKNYFEKNHSYRTGSMKLPPKRAFVVASIDIYKSGWGARPKEIYSNISYVQSRNNSSDSLKKFLSSIEGYEWGVINVFSGPRIHHFDYQEGSGFSPTFWNTKEGRGLIAKYSDEVHPRDVSWLDVKVAAPKVLFYHLLSSETGRHNFSDYLAGIYIFTGFGLAAIAGTQHSGSIGVPTLYQSLSSGKTIGEAWKDALNWSISHSGEKITVYWFDQKITSVEGKDPYKAVLIGDGTLKLPER